MVEKLRPAKIDVRGMLALIEPLEAEGTLVKRSRELRGRDRELSGRARRAHRRLRGALSLSRRQERRVRLPLRWQPNTATPVTASASSSPARSARRARRRSSRSPRTPRTGSRARLPRRPVDALPERRKALYNWRRGSKVFSREYNSPMARMVKCVKLGREAEGSISPLSRRARQAHLGERLEGSLGAVAQAADDAREREPPQPRRPARASTSWSRPSATSSAPAPTSPSATSRPTSRSGSRRQGREPDGCSHENRRAPRHRRSARQATRPKPVPEREIAKSATAEPRSSGATCVTCVCTVVACMVKPTPTHAMHTVASVDDVANASPP